MRIILIYKYTKLGIMKNFKLITAVTLALTTHVASSNDLDLTGIDVTAPLDNYMNSSSGSATKTDTPLIDLPQTVHVINQKQLQDQQATDLGRAIDYAPGVQLDAGEGNRDALIMRGNKTTSDLYIDGTRDDAQYFRDLYNIERVDVLLGANGILFGKGGIGGVVNRVSKQAQFGNFNSTSLQLGSFDNKRATLDINRQLTDNLAVRLNLLAHKSGSFIEQVNFEKQAINPVFTYKLSDETVIRFGREYFHDKRIGYRGIPSQNGRPYSGNRSHYYGVPGMSPNEVSVNSTFIDIEHVFSPKVKIKNMTRYTDYDKFYQNVYAGGAVSSSDTLTLKGYYDNTQRQNFFNQTDVTWQFNTGGLEHTLLTGLEIGKQDNRRYRITDSSQTVSIHDRRGSGWDFSGAPSRDKRADISYNSIYFQDQIKLNDQHKVVFGLRKDDYETKFNNVVDSYRTTIDDDMTSSRAGYIYSPTDNLSYYASYSTSYQPRNGDQLDGISNDNANKSPEKFINYEVGAKYFINPNLFATLALYQLERERMQVTDPVDSTKKILIDGQRSRGVEATINGKVTDKYTIVGGLNYVDAEITETHGTGSSQITKGTKLGNTSTHSFSLWNKYEIDSVYSVAAGIIGRSDMYAATPTASTSVTIPGWVRVDLAGFARIDDKTRLQLNVENLLDKEYYWAGHNVNNIMVARPLNARLTLIRDF